MKGRGNNYATGARVGLWKDGKCKEWLVARLIAITFLGFPSKGVDTVNHINGNRQDNRIENLEWLSIGDNVRHAFRTGLRPYNKIKLFNAECEYIFSSMSQASLFLNRNKGYIHMCLKKNRYALSKDNIKYNIQIVKKENKNGTSS